MSVIATLMRAISPARLAAFDVLEAVADGAYASDSLLTRCRTLTSRDAGLASQIVFGVLRFEAQLDWLIQKYSGRLAPDLDLSVRVALRSAIFQLRYLDRIPAHAAVHEAVEWIKIRKRAAAGLVNAVLRKVNRHPEPWPDLPTELSCPAWLLASWTSQFGPETARGIAEAALVPPASYLRVPPGTAPPAGVALKDTLIPGCFQIESPAPDGWRLQDIGSQAILPLLDLKPGMSFLDLCSAPGNKTVQALEDSPGFAVACDISFSRIACVPPLLPRVVLDAAVPLPFSRRFDRVFIDAPCSGTGTIGRNPEIKWRVQSADLGSFQTRQMAILQNALPLLEPGGKLLYATCSLEAVENGDVVRAVLEKTAQVGVLKEVSRIPGRDEGDGFYAALLG